ncbi:Formin homology 2 domain (FH2 domain)-containing protein [Dioscorea alata]|uniref:Formin homology 2 domain (FH2 domain)-containing protein n=1 Tax=Dioscorea alata TaxID=55571 RepID=A0ACB7U243_DIOAL|nr:Formin homology 2 domain (FH2 domain)-containing protein [Dioscorea alata]
MGCVHSRVENEETVRRCKERRRLMKQLLSCRSELASAHIAYLHSLRNTGATLRQFTEAESIIPVNSPVRLTLPPSPPPPLPPPPPPLPPSPPLPPLFSRKGGATLEKGNMVEGSIDDDDDDDDDVDIDVCLPPMPPPGSDWDFLDPFGPPSSSTSSSPVLKKKDEGAVLQAGEEENWAETNTEFVEDEEELDAVSNVVVNTMKDKSPLRDLADDTSSVVSGFTRDTDMAVVVWRSKKTMAGIVKELDDYFLKAAAAGKDLAVLLESNRGHRLDWNLEERKGKRSKSAKVFHGLSWNWSSKSLLSNRDGHFGDTGDTCRPGNHCTTLEKIYEEEQRLYKEVKEEEIAKYECKKKILQLQKLEAGDHDWTKVEKARANIEYLQSRILSLQESINGTCLSISKLRDEELHPQLLEISTGLTQMWRSMYECHQVQNHISQQVNLIDNQPGTEPTTETHRQATVQLENEVRSWYSSFCNLLRSQREYMHALNQWIRLTDCLPDSNDQTGSAIGIRLLGEEWQLALDRLPDKVTADAIKSFVSVVHSIVLQQIEERTLQKRSDRLENRLEKELDALAQLDRYNESMVTNQDQTMESKQHLLSSKQAKLDGLKKRVEDEKAKYFNSVRLSRAMTLNSLHASLPNVFQSLMGFSSVCVQAFEGIQRQCEANSGHAEVVSPLLP